MKQKRTGKRRGNRTRGKQEEKQSTLSHPPLISGIHSNSGNEVFAHIKKIKRMKERPTHRGFFVCEETKWPLWEEPR